MKTNFLDYMIDRFPKTDISNKKEEGPIVTISREFGCNGNNIARMLLEEISSKENKWKIINKEILHGAAKELNITPHRIDSISCSNEKGFFVDIVKGFSEKYYTNDKNVRNTISRIIQSFAKEKNVIIVGRGSVAVTQHIKKALHIKLIAPFDYRVKKLDEKRSKSIKEIKTYTAEIDKKRERLIKYFCNKTEPCYLYDATYNTKKMTDKEIVNSIVLLLKKRKLI